jgi:hypothetical protein
LIQIESTAEHIVGCQHQQLEVEKVNVDDQLVSSEELMPVPVELGNIAASNAGLQH